MFVNLDNTDSAYETARQCLPYYYAVAATSPHVQTMAAERLQAGWTPASSGRRSRASAITTWQPPTTFHTS